MSVFAAIIIALLILAGIVRMYEIGTPARLYKQWRSLGVPTRILAILAVAFFTLFGGSKGPVEVTRVLRLLFWDHFLTWPLSEAAQRTEAAEAANQITSNALTVVEAETNNVWTISFDWHAPQRLPFHETQNVLGYTPWVAQTNIDGVLYEDHFVSFNAVASTNPAVILIEYAGKDEDGNVIRYSSNVITNSFPDTTVITLQSGSYTCYWFRCAVPVAFTNSIRDWNGEALFGGPEGSGKGFDLLGTLVVDDGNSVWVGANTNMVFGSDTNIVRNGIITED